ncbi:MAG TPA: hypothetical protein VF844_00985 [Ktedonobacteraceae bacterium]
MSFTEDELQSFNTILEQRLTAHRREMERVFDQRMNEYRRELDQRYVQVDSLRTLSQKLSDFQIRLDSDLNEKLNALQMRITQTISNGVEQRQQQVEGSIDGMLAAQLLGIEQLLNQFSSRLMPGETTITTGVSTQLEAIEVQTELPWEDLIDVIGKTLDERLSMLNEAIQRSLKNLEQYLSVRLHSLRDEFLRNQTQGQGQQALYNGNTTTIQEVLHGIEHLERIIESMQVAMTSNHALLSNRLFHHQQLPLERAHPADDHTRSMPNGSNAALSLTEERVSHGSEPGVMPVQAEIEE